MPEIEAQEVDREFKQGGFLRKLIVSARTLGPGLITGASDDDPATIGTFAQTGVHFGYTQLWMVFFTLPLMVAVQEICARIGLETGEGLARLIRRHYPRPILYGSVLLLFIANTVNIGADLGAMAASADLLLHLPFVVWLIAFALVSAGLEIFLDYHQYSRVLRLFAFAILAYVVVAFVVPQDWGAAIRGTLVPTLRLNRDFLMNLVALLGTAISPYLYFWQTSEEVEEKIESGETEKVIDEGHEIEEGRTGVTRTELKWMRTDVSFGMVLANFVGWTIIITAASTLGRHGVQNISSATQFAQSLQPAAGSLAYLVFALGIIGTGLLTIPILAGSLAYAVSGTLNLREGLYLKLDQAPGFYGVIAISTLVGAGIDFFHINPIQALYYTSIINGIVAAPLLVLLMLISNNKEIMHNRTNNRLSNILGWTTTLAMILSAAAMLVTLFAGG
ncbi:MAG: Nramp family divalent metal transporter [Rudaea sp.]